MLLKELVEKCEYVNINLMDESGFDLMFDDNYLKTFENCEIKCINVSLKGHLNVYIWEVGVNYGR